MRTFLVLLFIVGALAAVVGAATFLRGGPPGVPLYAALATGFGVLTMAATGACAVLENEAGKTQALLREIRDYLTQ